MTLSPHPSNLDDVTRGHAPLSVVDHDSLDDAAAILHDAVFSRDSIAFDRTAKTFSVALWQPDAASAVVRPLFWRLVQRIIPERRWNLVFRNVVECAVRSTGHLKEGLEFCFSTMTLEEGEMMILTHYCLEIQLTVTMLDGVLITTDEIRFDHALKRLSIR